MSGVREVRAELEELKRELKDTKKEMLSYKNLAFDTLTLTTRLTGDENLNRGIKNMQRAITIVRELTLAYQALQVARMAAGDPLAWFQFGVTAGTALVDASSFLMESG